jgi:hypothetical protein
MKAFRNTAQRALLVVAVAVAALATMAPIANPTMTLEEAHGFQHLINEGDMLIFIRYHLPKDSWRVDSVDDPLNPLMEKADCHDGNENDPLDLCWTSLLPGAVTQTFYDGPQASGTLTANRTLPRISHGLAAVYIGAGHSLTFGDTTYVTCIEGSATLFSPRTIDCDTLLWHPITDTDSDGLFIDDAPSQNADALVQIAAALQDDMPGRQETLITNGLITLMGTIYFLEAFSNISAAMPDAFLIGKQRIDAVVLANTDSAAEIAITSSAQASKLWNYVNDFNVNHFDGVISTQLIGGVLILIVAFCIFGLAMAILKNLFLAASISALFIWGGGVLTDFVDLKVYMILLLLLFGVGMFSYARNKI